MVPAASVAIDNPKDSRPVSGLEINLVILLHLSSPLDDGAGAAGSLTVPLSVCLSVLAVSAVSAVCLRLHLAASELVLSSFL